MATAATLSLQQAHDDAPAEPLSSANLQTLGDPFFRLVLSEHADVTDLAQIEELIQPDPQRRALYVVSEDLVDSEPFGQLRRAVLTFRGTHRGETLHRNVMISVFFNSERFLPDLEVLAWDQHRGRYNYYKLDRSGTSEMGLTWKFRATSQDAGLLSVGDRHGTCLACHINGAPIMKELALPWNNWHSSSFAAAYLTRFGANRWEIARSDQFRRLAGAEELEIDFLLDSIRNFNTSRINKALARSFETGDIEEDDQGNQRVVEGRRLLRSLFVTTEVNFDSSLSTSGIHPFGGAAGDPAGSIEPPSSLFLNSKLIGGDPAARTNGLGILSAQRFSQAAAVSRQEYQDAVRRAELRIGGELGDANFAWFVPAPSHVDNDLVNQLMQRGIVPYHLVAAVLSIDLENPILSEKRASLLQFMPEEFSFRALAMGADPLGRPFDLTMEPADGLVPQIVAALEAADPEPDSAAGKLLARLLDESPRDLLGQDVQEYLGRVEADFEGTGEAATRADALDRLLDRASRVRQDFAEDLQLHVLDETARLPGGSRLLPLPPDS